MRSPGALRDDLVALSEAVLAISAVGELEHVLQAVVDHAHRYIGARYAALGVRNAQGDGFAHFVFAGMDDMEAAAIGALPRGRGVVGIPFRDGRALRLRDLTAHEASVGFPEHHPPMHSFLGVPIVHGGADLGNLYLTEKRDADAFTERDETLATLFARHAALAISNAHLVEALTVSEARYRRLSEGAPQIVFALDEDGQLTYVNERVLDQLGWAPEALVGRSLRALVRSEDRALLELQLHSLARGGPRADFAVRVRDARGATRHLDVSLAPVEPDGAVGSSATTFQGLARDVTARHTLAHEIATRTGELRSSHEERQQLRDFVSLIMQAQEEERARIAGDLHDTTVQTLTAVGRRLRSLCARGDLRNTVCEELAELADAALSEADEVRRLSRNLRPSVLDHLGLEAALRDLCDALTEARIPCTLVVTGNEPELGVRTRTCLFRIAQEALTNIRRHSEATSAEVHLQVLDDRAELLVRDDGRGYDPNAANGTAARRNERGLGTTGMRERARMVGGSLVIESQPGAGTTVRATVPVRM